MTINSGLHYLSRLRAFFIFSMIGRSYKCELLVVSRILYIFISTTVKITNIIIKKIIPAVDIILYNTVFIFTVNYYYLLSIIEVVTVR
jgi:hypothetical protein